MSPYAYTIIMLAVAAPVWAHADSPREQFESGVPLAEIRCSYGLVLLESPRGTPACVLDTSLPQLLSRGFVQLSDGTGSYGAGIPGQHELDPISGSNNLAVGIYRHLSDANENIFFSPPALYVLLAALHEGADGQAAGQIRDALRLEQNVIKRHEGVSMLASAINRSESGVVSHVANALWVEDGFELNDTYADFVRDSYGVDVLQYSLMDTSRVDDWAAGVIDNNMNDMSFSDLMAGQEMTASNVNYFDSIFQSTFEKSVTRPMMFWIDEVSHVTIDTVLARMGSIEMTELDYATLINIPGNWGEGYPYKRSHISLLFVVPHDMARLEHVERSLSYDSIHVWKEKLSGQRADITMNVPKFTLDTYHDLRGSLEGMGLTAVFGEPESGLGGIGHAEGYGPHLGGAPQRSFTAIADIAQDPQRDYTTEQVPHFSIDRPFLFLVWDEQSELILFMGRVTDPTNPSK